MIDNKRINESCNITDREFGLWCRNNEFKNEYLNVIDDCDINDNYDKGDSMKKGKI